MMPTLPKNFLGKGSLFKLILVIKLSTRYANTCFVAIRVPLFLSIEYLMEYRMSTGDGDRFVIYMNTECTYNQLIHVLS